MINSPNTNLGLTLGQGTQLLNTSQVSANMGTPTQRFQLVPALVNGEVKTLMLPLNTTPLAQPMAPRSAVVVGAVPSQTAPFQPTSSVISQVGQPSGPRPFVRAFTQSSQVNMTPINNSVSTGVAPCPTNASLLDTGVVNVVPSSQIAQSNQVNLTPVNNSVSTGVSPCLTNASLLDKSVLNVVPTGQIGTTQLNQVKSDLGTMMPSAVTNTSAVTTMTNLMINGHNLANNPLVENIDKKNYRVETGITPSSYDMSASSNNVRAYNHTSSNNVRAVFPTQNTPQNTSAVVRKFVLQGGKLVPIDVSTSMGQKIVGNQISTTLLNSLTTRQTPAGVKVITLNTNQMLQGKVTQAISHIPPSQRNSQAKVVFKTPNGVPVNFIPSPGNTTLGASSNAIPSFKIGSIGSLNNTGQQNNTTLNNFSSFSTTVNRNNLSNRSNCVPGKIYAKGTKHDQGFKIESVFSDYQKTHTTDAHSYITYDNPGDLGIKINSVYSLAGEFSQFENDKDNTCPSDIEGIKEAQELALNLKTEAEITNLISQKDEETNDSCDVISKELNKCVQGLANGLKATIKETSITDENILSREEALDSKLKEIMPEMIMPGVIQGTAKSDETDELKSNSESKLCSIKKPFFTGKRCKLIKRHSVTKDQPSKLKNVAVVTNKMRLISDTVNVSKLIKRSCGCGLNYVVVEDQANNQKKIHAGTNGENQISEHRSETVQPKVLNKSEGISNDDKNLDKISNINPLMEKGRPIGSRECPPEDNKEETGSNHSSEGIDISGQIWINVTPSIETETPIDTAALSPRTLDLLSSTTFPTCQPAVINQAMLATISGLEQVSHLASPEQIPQEPSESPAFKEGLSNILASDKVLTSQGIFIDSPSPGIVSEHKEPPKQNYSSLITTSLQTLLANYLNNPSFGIMSEQKEASKQDYQPCLTSTLEDHPAQNSPNITNSHVLQATQSNYPVKLSDQISQNSSEAPALPPANLPCYLGSEKILTNQEGILVKIPPLSILPQSNVPSQQNHPSFPLNVQDLMKDSSRQTSQKSSGSPVLQSVPSEGLYSNGTLTNQGAIMVKVPPSHVISQSDAPSKQNGTFSIPVKDLIKDSSKEITKNSSEGPVLQGNTSNILASDKILTNQGVIFVRLPPSSVTSQSNEFLNQNNPTSVTEKDSIKDSSKISQTLFGGPVLQATPSNFLATNQTNTNQGLFFINRLPSGGMSLKEPSKQNHPSSVRVKNLSLEPFKNTPQNLSEGPILQATPSNSLATDIIPTSQGGIPVNRPPSSITSQSNDPSKQNKSSAVIMKNFYKQQEVLQATSSNSVTTERIPTSQGFLVIKRQPSGIISMSPQNMPNESPKESPKLKYPCTVPVKDLIKNHKQISHTPLDGLSLQASPSGCLATDKQTTRQDVTVVKRLPSGVFSITKKSLKQNNPSSLTVKSMIANSKQTSLNYSGHPVSQATPSNDVASNEVPRIAWASKLNYPSTRNSTVKELLSANKNTGSPSGCSSLESTQAITPTEVKGQNPVSSETETDEEVKIRNSAARRRVGRPRKRRVGRPRKLKQSEDDLTDYMNSSDEEWTPKAKGFYSILKAEPSAGIANQSVHVSETDYGQNITTQSGRPKRDMKRLQSKLNHKRNQGRYKDSVSYISDKILPHINKTLPGGKTVNCVDSGSLELLPRSTEGSQNDVQLYEKQDSKEINTALKALGLEVDVYVCDTSNRKSEMTETNKNKAYTEIKERVTFEGELISQYLGKNFQPRVVLERLNLDKFYDNLKHGLSKRNILKRKQCATVEGDDEGNVKKTRRTKQNPKKNSLVDIKEVQKVEVVSNIDCAQNHNVDDDLLKTEDTNKHEMSLESENGDKDTEHIVNRITELRKMLEKQEKALAAVRKNRQKSKKTS